MSDYGEAEKWFPQVPRFVLSGWTVYQDILLAKVNQSERSAENNAAFAFDDEMKALDLMLLYSSGSAT